METLGKRRSVTDFGVDFSAAAVRAYSVAYFAHATKHGADKDDVTDFTQRQI